MRETEAALAFGLSGWPVRVHHARCDMHWRVLEVIEPTAARPAAERYVLLVHGPFAYLHGEGEQYITATRRDGQDASGSRMRRGQAVAGSSC